jgi:hypothetical protein
MGLQSVGGTMGRLVYSCGGGGSGGEAMDAITSGPPSGFLGPDLGARVLVGRPCSPTWI